MPDVLFDMTVRSDMYGLFDLATDYDRLPGLLPEYVPSVRVLSRRQETTVLEQHVRIGGRELVMTAKHVVSRPGRHDMFVLGGDIKGSRITELYETVQDGTRMRVHAHIIPRGAMRLSCMLGRVPFHDGLYSMYGRLAEVASRARP